MKRIIIPNVKVKLTSQLTVKAKFITAPKTKDDEYWLELSEDKFQYKKGERIMAKIEDIEAIKIEK